MFLSFLANLINKSWNFTYLISLFVLKCVIYILDLNPTSLNFYKNWLSYIVSESYFICGFYTCLFVSSCVCVKSQVKEGVEVQDMSLSFQEN